MKRYLVSRKVKMLSCTIGIIIFFSSFIIPSSLRFFPMLMPKTSIATLMANSSFSYLILVPTNIGSEDNSRLSYQLVCYAYNSSNQLITSYNPLKLTKSIPDSAYSKDMYLSTFKITKSSLSTLIPTNTYSFLRFSPYTDRTDPLLANYVSYSVFPVAADGVTGVISGKSVPIIRLNPSPPR